MLHEVDMLRLFISFSRFLSTITHIGKFSRDEILILIDRMLALNEANNAERYKLNKAPLAKSGYTFGRSQHDCGQRSDARDFIKNCLERAEVASEQIQIIIGKLEDYTQTLSPTELETVNNALSKNVEAINQFDLNHMNAAVDHVSAILTRSLTSEIGIKVKNIILEIDDPKLFLQLIDYHNQFHLSANGPLMRFLNGESIDRSDLAEGKVATIDPKKVIGGRLLGEIRRFINEYTKYGVENRNDCVRRQDNINSIDLIKFRPPSSGSTPPLPPPEGNHPAHGHPRPGTPNPTPGPRPLPPRPGTPPRPSPYPLPPRHRPAPPSTPPQPPRPAPTPNPPLPLPPPPRQPRPNPPHRPSPRPIPITPQPLPISSLNDVNDELVPQNLLDKENVNRCETKIDSLSELSEPSSSSFNPNRKTEPNKRSYSTYVSRSHFLANLPTKPIHPMHNSNNGVRRISKINFFAENYGKGSRLLSSRNKLVNCLISSIKMIK